MGGASVSRRPPVRLYSFCARPLGVKVRMPKHIRGAPRYLTLTEVCDVLGVGANWAVEHAKEIGGVQLASQWRFVADRLPGQKLYGAPWRVRVVAYEQTELGES